MIFDKNLPNSNLLKSFNRPLNAMTQIISLCENFINDVVGGDSFIIALTAAGDLFFVDDSLESVQISSAPIESVAVAGSKIIGLTKQ